LKTLTEWLNYLEHSHSISIDMGLERIEKVREQLNISPKCPIITVGGTNGKGSTSNFLSSILNIAGYKVGLYTSPHLIKFNERICINGVPCSDDDIIQSFKQVYNACTEINISLSYFEFTTLAAMLLFKQLNVEVIVLEVGLGGRLDAVNIFEPICAIVTSIGIDHTQYLGDTRELIAYEKAGIFRTNIPAICGDIDPPYSLIKHANDIGANLLLINQDFKYTTFENQWTWEFCNNYNYNYSSKSMPGIAHPALRGINQLQNASCALMALHSIRHILAVTNQDIRRGLIEIELQGRFTILPGKPAIVLDVAHNEHASKVLLDNMDRMGFYAKNIAVLGAMADKDIHSMLYPLKDIIDEWHVAELPTERSASLEQLTNAIHSINSKASIVMHKNIQHAYAAANDLATLHEGRVLVFGSFYTVAESLKVINNIGGQNKDHGHIKSFVKRSGRVTTSQQLALEKFSGQWIIPYAKSNITNDSKDLILEIGFGMGETTAHIAKHFAHKNFIAVEVHTAGVGALLKKITDNNISNIKIIQHDAIEVLRDMIADKSLSGVHIFFPDPWHKKKHNKRRLIQTHFLDLLIPKIKLNGYLHMATDWEDYAINILDVCTNYPLIENTSDNANGYVLKPEYRPTTKFENRGIKLGHGVWDIIFTKVQN
jgi:dihydrofolate synthase / folylpolyglutamate synthase